MAKGVNHIITAEVRTLNRLTDMESVYICLALESTPRKVEIKSEALLPKARIVAPATYSFKFNILDTF